MRLPGSLAEGLLDLRFPISHTSLAHWKEIGRHTSNDWDPLSVTCSCMLHVGVWTGPNMTGQSSMFESWSHQCRLFPFTFSNIYPFHLLKSPLGVPEPFWTTQITLVTLALDFEHTIIFYTSRDEKKKTPQFETNLNFLLLCLCHISCKPKSDSLKVETANCRRPKESVNFWFLLFCKIQTYKTFCQVYQNNIFF